MAGGFAGVDVFFVISGYLITRMILSEVGETGSFSYVRFYERRIRRLLPALFATLLLSAFAAILVFSPSALTDFGEAMMASALSVANFYFWQSSGYFDLASESRPLLHAWSLSVEEQFYFLWPFLLVVLSRLRGRSFAFTVCLIGLVSYVLSIGFYAAHNAKWAESFVLIIESIGGLSNTLFFMLPFRVFEFVMGASLVFIENKRLPQSKTHILSLLGLMLCLLSFVLLHDELLYPGPYAFLPCLGAALLIRYGNLSIVGFLLGNPVARFVGLISYSLYLVHWPLVVFWGQVRNDIGNLDRLAIFVMSFGLAIALYYCVERPFRSGRGRFSNISLKAYLLIVLLLVLTGLSFQFDNGWVWRLDNEAKKETFRSLPADQFHRQNYGGADYPDFGLIYENGDRTVFLVGDSHAQQYAAGVIEHLARPLGYSVFSYFGESCIHLPGFSRYGKDGNYDVSCPKYTNMAIKAISESGSDAKVFISHSWLSQLKKAALLNEEGQRLGRGAVLEDLQRGLLQFAQKVPDTKVFVLGALPGTGGKNLYDELNRPNLLQSPEELFAEYQYTHLEASIVSFNAFLKSVCAQMDNLVFLDPTAALCDGRKCSNFGPNGEYLYSDSSHLSKYGSKGVIEHYLPQINSVGGRAAP